MSMVDRAPLVSVVIPCFNAERWLAQAVDSALAQSLQELEVVVVNDGSTDRSREIAEQYGNRISLVHQVNSGVSVARREGVRRARGAFIKFLDADDLLPPGSLEKLLEVARAFPGDAVLGRSVAVDDRGNLVDERMYALPVHSPHHGLIPLEYLLTQPTSSGLWLLPRALVDMDGCFDPAASLGEEFVLCSALIDQQVQIRACDAVIYHARMHQSPSRLSRSRRESDHLRQAELMRMAAELIKHKIPDYDPFAMRCLARLSWSRGRDSLRMGARQAAERHFQLAQELDPGLTPVGSVLYCGISRLAGPFAAERILGALKRLLGRQHL